MGEIDVGNVKIILDANASQELKAIEDVVRSYQEYLFVLQNARAALKPLAQLGELEGLNLIVLEKERVPERILLKTI